MNRKLVFWPEAEAELAEAVDWYETRGKGLGADFMRAVDAALAAIQRNPNQYQIIKGRIRRPYCVGSRTASFTLRRNMRSPYLRVFTVGVIRKGGSNERNRACCYDRYYDLPVSYFLKPT